MTSLAYFLYIFLIVIPIAVCQNDTNDTMDYAVECEEGGPRKMVDGACVCTNCASDPPACEALDCHGGEAIEDGEYPECDANTCLEGREGECCEIVTCLNGGEMEDDGTCKCEGTNFGGDTCAEPDFKCKNEGIKVDGEDKCICEDDFEGDSCEEPKCYNDMPVTKEGECACQAGFYGKFCENIECYGMGTAGRDTKERKSICICDAPTIFEGTYCTKPTTGGWALLLGLPLAVGLLILAGAVWLARRRQNQNVRTQSHVYSSVPMARNPNI